MITIQCLVKSIADMFWQSLKILHNVNILDIINNARQKSDTAIKEFPVFFPFLLFEIILLFTQGIYDIFPKNQYTSKNICLLQNYRILTTQQCV